MWRSGWAGFKTQESVLSQKKKIKSNACCTITLSQWAWLCISHIFFASSLSNKQEKKTLRGAFFPFFSQTQSSHISRRETSYYSSLIWALDQTVASEWRENANVRAAWLLTGRVTAGETLILLQTEQCQEIKLSLHPWMVQ